MRSWNKYVIVDAKKLKEAFAIYQWGVETDPALKIAHFQNWYVGSQFTNEELKPLKTIQIYIFFCKFAIYQWGVETLKDML